MDLFMCLQGTSLRKSLLTSSAFIVFDTSMCYFMYFEATTLSESFVTVTAFITFNTSMSYFMCLLGTS